MFVLTRRRQLLLLFTVILATLYVLINQRHFSRYTGNHPWLGPGQCRNLTEHEMTHLLSLTYKTHNILQKLEIKHWLIFGSVFGALRFQSPLPWDDDVDIGINGDGKLSEIGISALLDALKAEGLQVSSERWSICSLVQVYNGHPSLHVDLMAFYNYNGWMKRRGLESWLMFINFNKYHTFPARLVESPLPRVQFGSNALPVPREGIEIQKYCYPHDWWKVVRPVRC